MSNDSGIQFEAVTYRRLTEEIAYQIEKLILEGKLIIGERLPPERELAERLQVSRNVLREGVSMLVQKGLLEVKPGSGTYVTRPGIESLSESLKFFIRFNSGALLDLVEARRPLEVEIAVLAAQRATEEDCQLIKEYLNEMEQNTENPEAYVEADICFHESLAKATHNSILNLLLNSIRDALRENITVLARYDPPAIAEAMRYHRRILAAVRQHDADKASVAMREHLESITRDLKRLEKQADNPV
jgi:GntR family transcriptional repressor for pyruvate dehydrogenase complex